MTGVLINCAAVIVGSFIGLLLGKHLKDTFKTLVFTCSGLVTIVMGIDMAIGSSNYLALLLSLLVGGGTGYLLRIEDGILKVGDRLEKALSVNRQGSGNGELFAKGFMTSSVLFCSGAMSIVGSIQAGTTGELNTLLIKSVMDGCMAVVFASIYGAGVIFSFLFILVYQGFFVLAGTWIQPLLGETGINEMSAAGGILLLMIGLGLLDIKKFRTANYLPVLILAPVSLSLMNFLSA